MFTVRKNCAQMLSDRGYLVAEVSKQGATQQHRVLVHAAFGLASCKGLSAMHAMQRVCVYIQEVILHV